MCKAIKDMLEKSREEGSAEVIAEVLTELVLDRISLPGNPRKLTPEEIEQLEKEGRV